MNFTEPEDLYTRKIDEVSARTVVLKSRSYLVMLISHWYLLVLVGAIGAYYNYKKVSGVLPTYNAKITLLIKTQEVAKENLITTQVFSVVARSRQMFEYTLLKTAEIEGKKDLLINHYISTYQLFYPEEFNQLVPDNYRFEKDDLEAFSRTELEYFDVVLDKVSLPLRDFSDGFVTISNNDKLGFINLNISTPSEELSLVFIDVLYHTLEELFNKSIVHADHLALNILKVKRDSIKRIFDKSFSTLLTRRETYEKKLKAKEEAGLSSLAKRIQRRELATELLKNDYLEYTERVKNAEVVLSNSVPFIYITERSRWPLSPYQPSILRAIAKGAFMGVFFTSILLFIRRIYQDILQEGATQSFSSN